MDTSKVVGPYGILMRFRKCSKESIPYRSSNKDIKRRGKDFEESIWICAKKVYNKSYLYSTIVDENAIQDIDNGVIFILIEESREDVNSKLKLWRQTLE
ncbi:hypothetical protein CR513_22213, partial [Mucuna pruriens]